MGYYQININDYLEKKKYIDIDTKYDLRIARKYF